MLPKTESWLVHAWKTQTKGGFFLKKVNSFLNEKNSKKKKINPK